MLLVNDPLYLDSIIKDIAVLGVLGTVSLIMMIVGLIVCFIVRKRRMKMHSVTELTVQVECS